MKSLEGQTAAPEVIEVHNVWQVLESGGPEYGFSSFFGRPQDWGDPAWLYFRYKLEMESGGRKYINHCHVWTKIKFEQVAEYPQTFAGLICFVAMPGQPEQKCGRSHLAEDDFWSKKWGKAPPFFFDGEDYDDDPLEIESKPAEAPETPEAPDSPA